MKTPEEIAAQREELKKAMAELDALENEPIEKSATDELDDLIKSAEAEFTGSFTPEIVIDDEPLYRSEQAQNDAALVEASEAFESLTKSVNDGIGGIHAEIAGLTKALAADLNLNIKTAQAIVGLTKSIAALGKMPVGTSETRIGAGSATRDLVPNDMAKSQSEISDALLKAVQDGKVAAKWLSTYGTHKNLEMLPEDVRTIIGA
jgi:hypothetical protein